MKLHHQKSYIRTQNEGSAPTRKAPKITQLLYILFILLILAYLVYFFVNRTFYLSATGLVELEKVDLGAVHGGQVEQLRFTEGDVFRKGDVLAVIGPARFCAPPEPDRRAQRLAFDIEDEKISLNGLQQELYLLRQQLKGAQSNALSVKRALEINAPLLNDDRDLVRLKQDIKKQQNEVRMQQNVITTMQARLKLIESEIAKNNNVQENPACQSQTIIAPFDGNVFSISHGRDEVANRGDVILTAIPQSGTVSIEVYLSSEEYSDIRGNKQFEVTLPDGFETRALVTKIDSSAIATPDRKLDGYKPLDPGVRLSLGAPDEATAQLWRTFDRYQVNVKGRK